MKTTALVKRATVLAFIMCASFIAFSQGAATDQARINYDKGLAAYNLKKYAEAKNHFEKSFLDKPTAVTAYMLAYCSLYTNNMAHTKYYIDIALKLLPPLQEPYFADAHKILDSCKKFEARNGNFVITGTITPP